MYGFESIIDICESVTFSEFFRKILTLHGQIFQKLCDHFDNGFVGKSCRQSVYRLEIVKDLLIR